MASAESLTCTAFAGTRRIAGGPRSEVARRVREILEGGEMASVLIFDDATGAQIELDLRGAVREADPGGGEVPDCTPARGPGRPRLGVVAREVTLLPRHWEWLNDQPGGASVALRKLVEEARRTHQGRDRVRRSQDAAYRFMVAMAGNFPGFEEATRALFAGDRARFGALVDPWPADVRDHARILAAEALAEGAGAC